MCNEEEINDNEMELPGEWMFNKERLHGEIRNKFFIVDPSQGDDVFVLGTDPQTNEMVPVCFNNEADAKVFLSYYNDIPETTTITQREIQFLNHGALLLTEI